MVYRGSEEAGPRGAAIISIIRVRDYFEMPHPPAVETFQFAACGGDVAILKAGGVCFRNRFGSIVFCLVQFAPCLICRVSQRLRYKFH
jgi:hypothetical protein